MTIRALHAPRRRHGGFSLVEMIGVLAIIAILAVVIVPKVFSTIASSRITSAVGSVTSMKSATAEFVGRYGAIPTTTATSRFDDLLVTAGFLESRFNTKVGAQPSTPVVAGGTWALAGGVWANNGAGSDQSTQTRLISMSVANAAAAPSTAVGANFRLNGGAGAAAGLPVGSVVVSAVLVNVSANDAWELSRRLDGDSLSGANANSADNNGKVAYAAGTGPKNVYIYVAHQ